jgi:hypothetical protein
MVAMPAPLRRIYVSMPADEFLTDGQNELKWNIVRHIEERGFACEIFFDPRGKRRLTSGRGWRLEEVEAIGRRCVGALFIGFPRWQVQTPAGLAGLATEFSQYEAGVLQTLGLPGLAVAEQGLIKRGVFDPAYGSVMAWFPAGANGRWLAGRHFKTARDGWLHRLSERRDIFLGYCGRSTKFAQKVKKILEGAGASVLDWKEFTQASTILEQIQLAARRCTAGVFLFTRDDKLAAGKAQAAPRDNVVFEAGYFIHAKGNERVLIVQQEDAKMPADLGGKIYEEIDDLTDLGQLKPGLERFVSDNL